MVAASFAASFAAWQNDDHVQFKMASQRREAFSYRIGKVVS
jgi:hypothetical protein